MANHKEGPRHWFWQSLAGAGFGVAGVWLVLLYVIFVSLVVFSLGAYQLQYAIRAYQVENGKSLPLWAINEIYSNWIKAEYEIQDIESSLYGARDELRAKNADRIAALINPGIDQTDYLEIVKEVSTLGDQVNQLELNLASATEALNSAISFQNKVLDPSVGDFVTSMKFFRVVHGYGGWLVPDFTALPPDILTIFLVLAMGALGGTIHLTRLYFDQHGRKRVAEIGAIRGISYYVFRPFLGAITAFSVYVLAKAGVLVLAAPSGGESASTLSPFFVSFLGIISGLLAEQALDTIQQTGRNWFSGASTIERERWGVALKHDLKDEDLAGLADVLGISTSDLRNWREEKSAVPEKAQVIISAWLKKPRRELFTDVGPDERAASA